MAAQRWSTTQVTALAPDAGSLTAARKLTSLRTWSDLGCTESLVWGKCQGSGKAPYQVTVDLTEPAFKCSCPSRKFPCKHGLALLLIWVEHGDAVGDAAAVADFAGEWADQRAGRAGKRAERQATRAATTEVTDPEAQARRRAAREAAITSGLDELERWLGDLVRQGLAAARRQPYSYWDTMAARLVDAQAPALADRVRVTGGEVLAEEDWADHLARECGRWALAVEAWRRRDRLDESTNGDLRTFLGWARRADEMATFPTVRDRWVVAGVREAQEGRILSQRTWLRGGETGRWVVVLDFAAAGAALSVAQPVGTAVEDELRLHPGAEPPRAVFGESRQVVGGGELPPGRSVATTLDELSAWLAADPWRDRLPVVLDGVVVVDDAQGWWLQDADEDRLPLAHGVEPWTLLAHSGGRPVTVAAEWDRGYLHPLAMRTALGEVLPL